MPLGIVHQRRACTQHGIGAVLRAKRLEALHADPVRLAEGIARYHRTQLDEGMAALPEIAGAFGGRFRIGVLLPGAARTVAPRYGFRRWPALVMLRDGAHVGAIDGLRNWDEYLAETQRLLDSEPTRPPSVGIAVRSAGGEAPGCGH